MNTETTLIQLKNRIITNKHLTVNVCEIMSDHLAEYATLKAMGYSNLYLLGVVFQEAIILAICGYFPGCLISIGLYGITRNATSLPLMMPINRVIQIFVLTIVMCVISGAIASRKLRSADPADIF